MPAYTLQQVNARADPAPSWRFRVALPTDVATNPFGAGSEVGNAFGAGSSDMINMRAEMVDVNHTYLDMQPSYVQGTQIHYPRAYTIDPIDITFYEDVNYTAFKFFTTWRNKIVDRNGNYGLPKDYKRTIDIFMQDYAGNEPMQFRYLGCWPMRVHAFQLNGEATDRVRTAVTFSVDQGGQYIGSTGGASVIDPASTEIM